MAIRYIGSKARIAPEILSIIGAPRDGDGFFVDGFSGTGIVGEEAAINGWPVRTNDHLYSSSIMSTVRLLGRDSINFNNVGGYEEAIDALNELPGRKGFIFEEYSPASVDDCGVERRYYSKENAGRIDSVRRQIASWRAEELIQDNEMFILLADLMEAANSVANIAGTYGCFMRKWNQNATKKLMLFPREIREKTYLHESFNCDINDVPTSAHDTVYLDPPYTKRQYAAYYHVMETIANGDRPKVSGVTGLRPWRSKASDFCYKTRALDAITSCIRGMEACHIYLSYSSQGHVALDDLKTSLSAIGSVNVISLGMIGRYRPNRSAVLSGDDVEEYLLDIEKTGFHDNV